MNGMPPFQNSNYATKNRNLTQSVTSNLLLSSFSVNFRGHHLLLKRQASHTARKPPKISRDTNLQAGLSMRRAESLENLG